MTIILLSHCDRGPKTSPRYHQGWIFVWEKKAESEYLSEKPFTYTLCRISEGGCAGLVVNRMLRGFPVALRLKILPAGGIKFKLKKEIFLFMHTASLQRVKDVPSSD